MQARLGLRELRLCLERPLLSRSRTRAVAAFESVCAGPGQCAGPGHCTSPGHRAGPGHRIRLDGRVRSARRAH
eukprot:1721569-Pleurochrysis_carterae.AAC.2